MGTGTCTRTHTRFQCLGPPWRAVRTSIVLVSPLVKVLHLVHGWCKENEREHMNLLDGRHCTEGIFLARAKQKLSSKGRKIGIRQRCSPSAGARACCPLLSIPTLPKHDEALALHPPPLRQKACPHSQPPYHSSPYNNSARAHRAGMRI